MICINQISRKGGLRYQLKFLGGYLWGISSLALLMVDRCLKMEIKGWSDPRGS